MSGCDRFGYTVVRRVYHGVVLLMVLLLLLVLTIGVWLGIEIRLV